ncbi:MAG: NTP transferase domain-containing protein [Bacteroidetes bacterium]|nr:NTP transferase domain-containing protein [Bacteroidota bacterium]
MTITHSFAGAPVLILAAGFSNRMGQSKALLAFDKDKTFLEKIIEEYIKYGSSEIIVVINKNIEKEIIKNQILIENTRFVINKNPENGRWSSILTGLKILGKKNNCFIQNVDNPFVSADLLFDMETKISFDNYVAPVFKGKGGHPILLGNEIIKNILAMDETDRDLKGFLKKFNRTEVETNDKNILVNINTIDDYKKIFVI